MITAQAKSADKPPYWTREEIEQRCKACVVCGSLEVKFVDACGDPPSGYCRECGEPKFAAKGGAR